MAGGVNAAIAAQRSNIQSLANALNQKRMGDFRFTQNALDSIFSNLSTTGKGISAQLSAEQGRTLAAMQALAARSGRQASSSLLGAKGAARNAYGSAMGKAISTDFAPAAARVSGTQAITGAAVKGGKLTATGGKTGLAAEQAGAQEAQAGANYALATALSQRTSQDQATIAQARLQLQSQVLQAQLTQDNYRAQLQAQYDYANRKADPQSAANLNFIGMVAPRMASWLNSYMGSNKNASVQDIMGAYAAQFGVNGQVDQNSSSLLAQVAANVQAGMSPTEATQTAVQAMYGSLSGYNANQMNAAISAGIQAQLAAGRAAATQQAAAGAAPDGGPGSINPFARSQGAAGPFGAFWNLLGHTSDWVTGRGWNGQG